MANLASYWKKTDNYFQKKSIINVTLMVDKIWKEQYVHSSLWKMLIVRMDVERFFIVKMETYSCFPLRNKDIMMFISQSVSNWYLYDRLQSQCSTIRCLGKVRMEVKHNSQWDPHVSSSFPLSSPLFHEFILRGSVLYTMYPETAANNKWYPYKFCMKIP